MLLSIGCILYIMGYKKIVYLISTDTYPVFVKKNAKIHKTNQTHNYETRRRNMPQMITIGAGDGFNAGFLAGYHSDGSRFAGKYNRLSLILP